MNFNNKIVTKIPLDNIWTSEHELNSSRISYLTLDKLTDLIKQGPVNFIIAGVGQKLIWIDTKECFSFWKSEIKKHFVDTDISAINLDSFPDNYAYIASQWVADDHMPIILLEKIH